ncbi:MAG TPA: hypothetical protein VGZ26_06325, partial [Pirellulales bacterium]|jgi:hypothetical protein|nr:hypothetical protein [Pirellulales bacterium]
VTEAPIVATLASPTRPGVLGLAASAIEWVFGTATLIVGLSVLATIPVVQVLSLGYLLEVSGRVARVGRLRAGFVGVRKAARLGRVAVGVAILMVPLWIASSLRFSAHLIDPTSPAARGWNLALTVLSALVLLQTVGAFLRGARIRHFLWPRPIQSLRFALRAGAYATARDAVWDFVVELRLPYYFWLGLRGFWGAAIWLVLPVSLLALASRLRLAAGTSVGLVGGGLLALVLVHLPFLQARFAQEDRLGAMFELRPLRRQFGRAPVAFFVALLFTLLLALPLYLLKIEIVPREAAWLPSVLFVISMFPARLLSGWALARSGRREAPRHWLWRWTSRLAMLPVTLLYVALVYFTQYLSWYGLWSLYEQHAFLVPAPFLGL